MIGSKLAHYEITSHLGTGGMGEVYQATDAKLGRSVAIKLVPAVFSHDSERVARFEREARVLASLNHPNIAAIYGVEESDGRKFLVMELVPGETLADQIRRGPRPIDEILAIAKQIADGLEAAHEKGVVHRDLKPANIKITPQGQVKVLDFGLAKAFSGEASDVNLSNSPTLNWAATNVGMIMGTAAYMSPEQAKGKETDRTSDIWSFGCVLYEMLTGRAAFEGETLGEILGSVFKSEPDWAALPQTTPPAILSLLKRCLQKDRSRRMRDIADARFQIEEAMNEPASHAAAAPSRKSRERLLWIAATLALTFGLVLSMLYFRNTPAAIPEMRLEISTPPGADLSGFAISPNGRQLVFQATVEGKNQLWLRPLGSETAQPLAGTENGSYPFWSPDSRSVGFFARGQLKTIDIAGGLVQTLADAPLNTRGGSWSKDGTIVFTHSSIEPLFRVPASGGKAVPATEVKGPHRGHRYPHFFPDGRHFMFFAFGPTESQGVYVGSLDSLESKRLLDSDSAAVFAPPDYVLFARQGAVLAQRVNLETLQTIGDPLPVARQAATNSGTVADIALSASMAGPIAYRANTGERQYRWVGRSGQSMGALGAPDAHQPNYVRISPDGRTVAVTRMVDGNNDVWLMETARDARQRFTTDPGREYDPLWSPDGSRIIFSSTRRGPNDLYQKYVSRAEPETLLFESPESKNAYSWSSDGRWLLFATQSTNTARDLWVLPLTGEKKPIAVAQTSSEEAEGQFSPDGRWIAYTSNESGRFEIYIQPFPGPGERSQISTGGGRFPHWRKDGKELFYLGPDNSLMAQSPGLNGPKAEPGTPIALFSLSSGVNFAPSPDGQKFLVNEITKEASPITILLNWKP
jgi:serine/threonine protein kinase